MKVEQNDGMALKQCNNITRIKTNMGLKIRMHISMDILITIRHTFEDGNENKGEIGIKLMLKMELQ